MYFHRCIQFFFSFIICPTFLKMKKCQRKEMAKKHRWKVKTTAAQSSFFNQCVRKVHLLIHAKICGTFTIKPYFYSDVTLLMRFLLLSLCDNINVHDITASTVAILDKDKILYQGSVGGFKKKHGYGFKNYTLSQTSQFNSPHHVMRHCPVQNNCRPKYWKQYFHAI